MPVAQEDCLGCGAACVAGRLGISYEQALCYFQKPENARHVGFYGRDIVKALERAGLRNLNWRYLKPRLRSRIYKTGTIVFIARSRKKGFPEGHYLLRLKNGWMDSWINYPAKNPIQAGIRKRLPGRPIYAVFEH